MKRKQKIFGRHYLVEFIDCQTEALEKVASVEALFLEAARVSQATILHHVFHQFGPIGVTGFILLSESHFALHTWPQDGYAAFDVFTCGVMFPERGIDLLAKGFSAKKVVTQVVDRGITTAGC